MKGLLSWEDVFDAHKLFNHPLLDSMKEECANTIRKTGYQFMAFNEHVYFIAHGELNAFCSVEALTDESPLTEKEMHFLKDTRDILNGYNNGHSENELLGAIDETRERLSAFLKGNLQSYEENL